MVATLLNQRKAKRINVDTTEDIVDGDVSSVAALELNKGDDGSISLREAVLAANADSTPDVIYLEAGEYKLENTLNNPEGDFGDLDITAPLTIQGQGSETIISGVEISGNTASGDGGGIYLESGELTAFDLNVNLNTATLSTITSSEGGGALVTNNGTLTVYQSSFSNNQANRGAGLHVGGLFEAADTTFSNNRSTAVGAAIRNEGTIDITRSLFVDNRTDANGAGVFSSGTTRITDSTFSNNYAGGNGAAIRVLNGDTTVLRSTIADNTSDSNDRALSLNFQNSINGTASLTIQSSLIARNSVISGSAFGTDSIISTGFNLSDTIIPNAKASDKQFELMNTDHPALLLALQL